MLQARCHGKKEVLNISVFGQRFWMEQLSFYVIDSSAVAPAPDDKTGSLNCFNDQSLEILWKICCKYQNETPEISYSINNVKSSMCSTYNLDG